MNQRIRELAEQAGFTTDEANITIGNYKDGNEYFYAEDFIEDELKKFAELIVLECARVSATKAGTFDKDSFVAKRIKQHFGVEE